MMSYIPIEDKPGYVKNQDTGVILNINKTEVEQARERKRLRKLKDQELVDIKNDIRDLKEMVLKLIEKQ